MPATTAQQVRDKLAALMRELDNHEELDEHPIRDSTAYQAAAEALGWHIDWATVYEDRH